MPHDGYLRQKFLIVEPDASLYDRLEMSPGFRVGTQRVEPLPAFHQVTTVRLGDEYGQWARVPYSQVPVVPNFIGDVTAVNSTLFSGSVAVTRVRGNFTIPVKEDLGEALSGLRDLRSARGQSLVARLIRAMAGALQGRPRNPDMSLKYDQYFAMRVALPLARADLDKFVQAEALSLVALLIGTPDPRTLRPGLVDDLIARNADLNGKAAGELLLLNRQGFLYLVPHGSYRGPHQARFEKTRDLAILANYAHTFLSSAHEFRHLNPAAANDTVRRLRQWVEQHRTTFDASVTQSISWNALKRSLQLQEELAAWDLYFESP